MKPPTELAPQLHSSAVAKTELDLVNTLLEEFSDDGFELSNWQNQYSDDLRSGMQSASAK